MYTDLQSKDLYVQLSNYEGKIPNSKIPEKWKMVLNDIN